MVTVSQIYMLLYSVEPRVAPHHTARLIPRTTADHSRYSEERSKRPPRYTAAFHR